MTLPASDMPPAYNPAQVEGPIYQSWMDKGYFKPRIPSSGGRKPALSAVEGKPFVIIMPPPNVTGELHLGHALTAAIEDMLARWHRMKGEPTLLLPGTDHAGIATQVVVERDLAKEGETSRLALGRQEFERRVWQWVDRYGSRINEQIKRLGTSCDWSRKAFTLDPGPSKAVRTTFVNLYNKGLIYRGERIINWCVRCATALSDLETVHQPTSGKLYYVNYPLADGKGHITVATTRPETMLSDTAVAVNPKDKRYKRLVGKTALLPILNRPIPIVADNAVDPSFGTGAVKVTPGHDPTDFDIGQRHNLPIRIAIGFDGKMTAEAGPFQGLDRFKARQAVVERLEQDGLLEKTEPYQHSVGHCQRCNTVVEPLVSKQWFVKVGSHTEPDSIAGRAYAAVADGRIQIVPERFAKVYNNWMENIRDWCISRQLWWGHRIPVWYCDKAHMTVAIENPAACANCGSTDITQDPDVLDTWFSSALWPHSTLGWPDDTTDLRHFYPTSVMETGYDILFFWVARMIMMGMENTGDIPFRTVFLHGLVRDAQGIKMSKTKGNVLDPLKLIDLYGTDALRFALTTGTAPGNDLRLSEKKLESARNFANKLWNASRFVISNLEKADSLAGWYDLSEPTHREDLWIVSRLHRTAQRVNDALDRFETGEAQSAVYDFLWDDFCDWYLELAKVRLRSAQAPPQPDHSIGGGRSIGPLPVLAHVLERTLRLLHPFMPFVTEEVWQKITGVLPKEGRLPDSIMVAPYPQADASRFDPAAEAEIGQLMTLVRSIRNVRAQLRVDANARLQALVDPKTHTTLVRDERAAIETLARLESLDVVQGLESAPKDGTVTVVAGQVVVGLPLGGLVDVAAERHRLTNELNDAQQNLTRVQALLGKPDFASKAPEDVVEREQERAEGLRERVARLGEVLAQLGD
ncbi:MAG: valine--tRNA ligase [SAR202 cluster bacterium]|nr:valine--tRNA ligase [SAR202 cluster bacterium]